MRIKSSLLLISLISGSLTLCAQVDAQKFQFQRSTLLKNEISILSKGKTLKVPVMIEQIILESRQQVKLELPVKGLWLVQLKGGEATVSIDGKKNEFNTDDFLIVASSSECIIQTGDDSVIIQVYAIGDEYFQLIKNKPMRSAYTKPEGSFKEVVANAFIKDVYRIGDAKIPLAIIKDINVGPGKKTGDLKFEGPALLQVLSGGGIIAIDGKGGPAGLGTSLALNGGSTLVITNNNEKKGPFRLRALIYQK